MRFAFLSLIIIISSCSAPSTESNTQTILEKKAADYQDLTELFAVWRDFENPPMLDGAPDYTKAGFDARHPQFKELQNQLLSMDTSGWALKEKIDWTIVWAEMNGYDFNYRILRPWERDPAFYKSLWMYRSDVPAHEGPTHHATTEIWQYELPVTGTERDQLLASLNVIPLLNKQAKTNLTGNARDLWDTGIRTIEQQSKNLKGILALEEISSDEDLVGAIEKAISSTDDLVQWLKDESPKKDGPSGLGKENYTWYLQNVHLVPLTWEDEVMILKRELARAWSALKLEEHRNRNIPQIKPVESQEEYAALADESATSLINFLEKDEIVTVKDYFDPALRVHLGQFVPEETRNFFWITAHHDPRPLYSHFYHWFELARMDTEPNPSPIRKVPLLYNIFDSRNEGMATGVEEMFMDAGLYDDSPRSREIVYILIAQRAARGLGSLYAHANEMNSAEAGEIHTEYTPRGWMKTEKELLIFEQHLYLRQPGYGTSYITGKYLLEDAMMAYALKQEKQNKPFALRDFFDKMNAIGNIPMSLAKEELISD